MQALIPPIEDAFEDVSRLGEACSSYKPTKALSAAQRCSISLNLTPGRGRDRAQPGSEAVSSVGLKCSAWPVSHQPTMARVWKGCLKAFAIAHLNNDWIHRCSYRYHQRKHRTDEVGPEPAHRSFPATAGCTKSSGCPWKILEDPGRIWLWWLLLLLLLHRQGDGVPGRRARL